MVNALLRAMKKTIYREIHKEKRAEQTVRNLVNAGIKVGHVETKTLYPETEPVSDAGRGPRRRASAYTLFGLTTGALFGVLMAALVFWIPAALMGVPYENLIMWIGLLLFIPVGIGLGLLEFVKRAKREESSERKSSDGKRAIGVSVVAEDPREQGLAQSVFAASEVKDVRNSNGNGKSH